MSYSLNTTANDTGDSGSNETWGQWSDDIFQQEKKVARDHIPLVLSTSLATAIYSYTMIDKSTNNAINRALLMALSTFLGASAVNMLQNNQYLDTSGNTPMYVEAAMIPLFYYFITKKQFQIPDVNSQALKTGVIASVVGQLANPTVTSYYNSWGTTKTTSTKQ
jgi:hypothetical protein